MSTIFTEGFDKYGPPGLAGNIGINGQVSIPNLTGLLTQGEWTVANTNTNNGAWRIVSGLSETGFALQFGTPFGYRNYGANGLLKTLSQSYSRIIGGLRFETPLQDTWGVTFLDSTTAQFSIVSQNITGLFYVSQGASTTQFQTSSASVTANTIHYLEWDITFGVGSGGSWTVWLDGVQILAGTGTTQQSANASFNVFQILPGGNPINVDDLYLFSSTGSTNNAVLLSNPRIETSFPTGDYQTQFTNNGNTVGCTAMPGLPSFTNVLGAAFCVDNQNTTSINANSMYVLPFTPNVNCTANSLSIFPLTTSTGVKFIPILYNNSAGAPTTLITGGTAVVGCTSGILLTLNFTTPSALVAGTEYWAGYMVDTSNIQMALRDNNLTNYGKSGSATFTSGPPSTAPTVSAGAGTFSSALNCTGAITNYESCNINPPPAAFLGNDAASIISSTPGQEDLYIFPSLSADVTQVYSVAVKSYARLQFTGTRQIGMRCLSGTTDSGGSLSAVQPTTSYVWYDSYFDTDPNTGSKWLTTGVGAAYYGPKVIT